MNIYVLIVNVVTTFVMLRKRVREGLGKDRSPKGALELTLNLVNNNWTTGWDSKLTSLKSLKLQKLLDLTLFVLLVLTGQSFLLALQ